MSNRDDVYKGFFIPKGLISLSLNLLNVNQLKKGSIMVANAWFDGCSSDR